MGDDRKSINWRGHEQPPRSDSDVAVDMAIGEEIAVLTPEQEERFRRARERGEADLASDLLPTLDDDLPCHDVAARLRERVEKLRGLPDKGYFTLGEPPRDDVEAAAQLLVRYRAAKLTGPEFGEMFLRMVNDIHAIVKRVDELEHELKSR